MNRQALAAILLFLVTIPAAHGQDGEVINGPARIPPAGDRAERVRELLAGNDIPPRLEAGDRPAVIEEALGGNFRAVWALAISGYSAEAAGALTQIAGDAKADAGVRTYAAMGLRNYANHMNKEERDAARNAMIQWLNQKRGHMDQTAMQLLVDLDGAALVQQTLGKDLEGHPLEVLVLERVPGKDAGERLFAICQANAKLGNANQARLVEEAGRALVKRNDPRGVDALMTMLPQATGIDNQQRSNTLNFLARCLGQNFGYPPGNYREALEAVVPDMAKWWTENRKEWGAKVEKPAK